MNLANVRREIGRYYFFRQQIVFNIHTPDKPKIQIAKQNYRCAGCGAKVEIAFAKRLRYCNYLGKYFCACCHSNETFVIPGSKSCGDMVPKKSPLEVEVFRFFP